MIVVFNALMGLPPVVAGLIVYLMLSRSGPLGSLALLFTPHPSPDIHFESLGETTWRMVAPVTSGLAGLGDVTSERYVRANLSPAFARSHDALLPHLALAPLGAGQGAVVRGMMLALGVAGYQETRASRPLIESGLVQAIDGAPILTQPIYAAIHLRNRHRAVWRKLIGALRGALGETT